MSKFDLRDISDRLTQSRDTEAVVFEFLGYVQAMRPDWRATLAFYEVSRDALVHTYEREGNRLIRRDIAIPIDHLPARLVRKFFHPSAFFNQSDRRTLFSHLFGAAPTYSPDPLEAPALAPIAPMSRWESCVCMPLADQEDVLALLVIASTQRNALTARDVGELVPIKSIAALALSQHLHRALRGREGGEPASAPDAAAEFQERVQRLTAHASALEQENETKARQLEALGREIEQLDKHSSGYRTELERVKSALFALEEQASAATQHLTDAYSQLNVSQARLSELQRTVTFVQETCQALNRDHEAETFPAMLAAWFCKHFEIERCSLMRPDASGETLQIVAQRGIDPQLAARVRVRVGQGIAGWVAHNRRPLFVRVAEESHAIAPIGRDSYNSDSFISVPLVHGERLLGVLNLSNKRAGEAFDEMDLERALIAATMAAVVLGAHEQIRRTAILK